MRIGKVFRARTLEFLSPTEGILETIKSHWCKFSGTTVGLRRFQGSLHAWLMIHALTMQPALGKGRNSSGSASVTTPPSYSAGCMSWIVQHQWWSRSHSHSLKAVAVCAVWAAWFYVHHSAAANHVDLIARGGVGRLWRFHGHIACRARQG